MIDYKLSFLLYLLLALYIIVTAFTISKKDYLSVKLSYLFNLSFISCAASGLSRSIAPLYLVILLQIVEFIASIKVLKTFSSKITYYILLTIISIFAVISITCSFGYYYMETDAIDMSNYIENSINIPFISSLVNGASCGLYLFKNSLKYYFYYDSTFVPQTQFYIGIALSCIIFESIFSIIRSFIKYKE